jgi:hypothetical protein
MKKIINFSDKTLSLIDFIKKTEGHNNFSATVISIISNYYKKEYFDKRGKNNIQEVEEPKEYTNTQKCEMGGGHIFDNNGVISCMGFNGLPNLVFPLDEIDKHIIK